MGATPATRTGLLTVPALIAFAANSLLCRAALGPASIDAASFTTVRLGSGAAMLALVHAATRGGRARAGSWISAAMLFVYAAAFSMAYVRIGAGVGALVLFGSVQATMLGWALVRGERPGPLQWLGFGLALSGLGWLTLRGAQTPDRTGAVLMICAGVAWGVYSLRGRGAKDPLAVTADNFARALPLAIALSIYLFRTAHASPAGLEFAATSGALASGIGYILWYAALPGLTATRAAAVQLSVPILAAGAAVLLLGESLTLRLVISGLAILLGVSLALRKR